MIYDGDSISGSVGRLVDDNSVVRAEVDVSVVEFTLEIVTCDHFSSLCIGRDDEVIDEMQEALKKSQGGILKGRVVDHLMLNYNRAKIAF